MDNQYDKTNAVYRVTENKRHTFAITSLNFRHENDESTTIYHSVPHDVDLRRQWYLGCIWSNIV